MTVLTAALIYINMCIYLYIYLFMYNYVFHDSLT